MNAAPISKAVRQFIHDSIYSVEQLEVLLLLRDAPEKQWSVAEISKELQTTEASVASRLAILQDLDLQETHHDGSGCFYSYRCPDPEMTLVITALERAYRERKDTVISLIFAPRRSNLEVQTSTFMSRGERH